MMDREDGSRRRQDSGDESLDGPVAIGERGRNLYGDLIQARRARRQRSAINRGWHVIDGDAGQGTGGVGLVAGNRDTRGRRRIGWAKSGGPKDDHIAGFGGGLGMYSTAAIARGEMSIGKPITGLPKT